jgi:amino acid transporter
MGYYDVCYIGDEVRDPARTIPRSILYCILATSVGYLAIETVIIGVMPWQQAMKSNFVVSEFIQQLHGRPAAIAVTAMIMWTAFGSVFALLLGYSRIPYAAAKDGYFFRPFARVHPTQHFPHVSLLAIGAVAIGAAFFKLETVISAMMTTRILVQFIAQIFALPLLRKRLPLSQRPYRMWLYPLPAGAALVGWVYIFSTAGWKYIAAGLITLAVGVAIFFVRAKMTRTWPYAPAQVET